jgi:hypothetical protein
MNQNSFKENLLFHLSILFKILFKKLVDKEIKQMTKSDKSKLELNTYNIGI